MSKGNRQASRYQREQRITAASWAVLAVVIAAVSVWAHYRSAPRQPDSPTPPSIALAPQTRLQLRAWLTESEPLINALVIARNNIAASAAERDIAATGTACQSATDAVADLHRQLPSPTPGLTTTFAQAVSNYDLGLPYCIGASGVRDGHGMQQAATFITQGDAAMRAALDFLQHIPGCEPRDVPVLIV